MRKEPRQERARATVEAILEAAARILDRQGWKGFTTNAVAEVAGVSIGSLYQYFPNKAASLPSEQSQRSLALRAQVLGAGACSTDAGSISRYRS